MKSGNAQEKPVKTAVITGGHAFDVIGFTQLCRALEKVDAYIQHMDDFSASPQEVRESYDVVLFYTMMMGTPGDTEISKSALEALGESGQGLVILHHALLAYPEWPLWDEIVGIPDRSFDYDHDQDLTFKIEDSEHPITQGLQGWRMVDETYAMAGAGQDSQVLLTADHPKSIPTIAWTRRYKRSRVFCYQSGHDNTAFADPNFRRFLSSGIRWAAETL